MKLTDLHLFTKISLKVLNEVKRQSRFIDINYEKDQQPSPKGGGFLCFAKFQR